MAWRDHLKIHPAADLFPLMSESELRELGENIKARDGIHVPLILYEGKLLDGRNRLDAMELVGIKLDWKGGKLNGLVHHLDRSTDPYEFVISANLHRRHLTSEQKRELIARVLKAKPEASNAAVAKQVKADDKTVAKVRGELESRSEIPNVNVRTDSRGRKQPAKRKRRISKEEKEFHEKREARKSKMQADWLADHPGRTVEDFEIAGTCSDTPEGEAAFRAWLAKRRGVLDTPSGPMTSAAAEQRATGSADTEFTEEEHRKRMAMLDPAESEQTTAEPATTAPAPDPEKSRNALANFKFGCKTWLPALTDDDWASARAFFDEYAMHRARG